MYLYMVIIGCTPQGRHTEQHDVYFGIAPNMAAMLPQLQKFWPEAADNMHVDAFRKVTSVDGYNIKVVPRVEEIAPQEQALFFINLGGYKPNEMEEFHYKMVAIGKDKGEAILKAKATAFYKHTGFGKANSHVDDKFGVDVDDIYAIEDILPKELLDEYQLDITKATATKEDELHLGYFTFKKLAAEDYEPS
jgi:hypothetical protein